MTSRVLGVCVLSGAIVAAAELPPITVPVMFDTPEADRILAAMQIFPPDNPWNEDISSRPVDPQSKAIVSSIGADRPLGYNLDMNFIIVPPGATESARARDDVPERVGPGTVSGAAERADRELAADTQRGHRRAAEAGRHAGAVPARGHRAIGT